MKQIHITKTITDHSDESVATYLNSIAKLTPLQAEEEAELARLICQGNRQALEKLIRANLRFVVTVAKQFQSRGLDLADLIEEGNIGLCKAAERFDGTRGFRFISFAVSYIQQAILDALAEKGRLVRLPHGQVNLLNKIRSIQSRYEQEWHRAAELEEIARELDMTPDRVQSILNADRHACRLDAPLADDSDTSVSDYLSAVDDTSADTLLEQESTSMELNMLLHSTLRERDIYVIRHLYGLGCEELSQTEIAERLGLSRESIRQIRDRALIKLRGAGSARTTLAHSA